MYYIIGMVLYKMEREEVCDGAKYKLSSFIQVEKTTVKFFFERDNNGTTIDEQNFKLFYEQVDGIKKYT